MKFYAPILLLLCSIAATPQRMATPRAGQSIRQFLADNRLDAQYISDFIALNRHRLGRDNMLLHGISYELPIPEYELTDAEPPAEAPKKRKKTGTKTDASASNAIGTRRNEPLFGPQYADYTVKTDALRGAVFYLVGGHGGPDCGCIGKAEGHEIHEDEYAYDIMLRLARNLLIEGADVHIVIRDAKDGIRDERILRNSKRETCGKRKIPLNQRKRLQQRCDHINHLSRNYTGRYQRAIFIHLDSRSTRHQLDVYFYHHPDSRAGKQLGNTMRETFRRHYDTHQPDRGFTGTVTGRELFVLTNSRPVCLFAELGNIRNSFDQRRFLLSSNRQALANWMCRGFIDDYRENRPR